MSGKRDDLQRVQGSVRGFIHEPKALWGLIKEAVSAWSADYAPSMGAALSYYTVFSIAPLLLIIIAIAGLVFGREAASGQIFGQLSGLVGEDSAAAIQGMVSSASNKGASTIASIVGFVTLLLGATGVFGELQTDLDRIWKAPAAEKKEGIWNLLRTRVLSFGMVLAIGFLLIVSLVVSAGLDALGSWFGSILGDLDVLLKILNFVVSFAVLTALFALMYKFLPRVKIAWPDVWLGAAVTALLFTIGKFLIGLYIGHSSVASSYGAAGSLVILLLWVYYSAQILLLGAEFTAAYAHRYGSRVGEARAEHDRDPSTVHDVGTPAGPSTHTRPARAAPVSALARHPKAELGLGVALYALAAAVAWWRGRLK